MSRVVLRILSENEEVAKFYNPSGQAGAIRGDSGLDLHTWRVTKVGERQFKIDFGVRCEMRDGEQYLSYMLVPRSSIVKTPYRMSNSIGIIDSGYRGNIMAFVDVLGDGPVVEPRVGERLFQIIRPTLDKFDYEIVSELSQTERGTGGFGSTGV
jgi:dUTP pyrophosphatase